MNTSALSLRALVTGALVASGLATVAAVGPVSTASAAPAFTADGDSVFVVHSTTSTAGSQNPRKVAGDGTVSTLTLTNSAWLLRGGAVAPDGTLYLQDGSVVPTRVVKIAPDGTESTVAQLDFPAAGQAAPTSGDVTILPDGDLVVAAYRNPNTKFVRVDPATGTSTTLFTLTNGESAARIASDAAGNLYYLTTVTSPKKVWKVSPTVGATPTLVGEAGAVGYDMTVDPVGNVYVAGGVGVSSANHGEIHKLALQGNGSYAAAAVWAATPTVAQGAYSADGGITVTPNGQVVLARSDGAGNATFYRYSSTGGTAVATQPVTGVYPQFLTSLPAANPFTDAVDASISGTVQVGQALTASAGTYAPGDATLAYAWKVGSDTVSTTSSYTPRLADAGKSLTLTVTGSKAGYANSVSTTSGQTVATVQGFTGTLKAGQTLTASDATGTSSWVLSTTSSCTSLAGTTGTTYVLPADSAGKYVQLWQTLNDRTGVGACVGPIAAAASAPTITGAATAAGVKDGSFSYTPTVGGAPAPTVTVVGTLPAGVTVNPVSGKLTGTPSEAGTFPVTLKADNGVGSAATVDVTITIDDVVTGLSPTISGTPKVGVQLTASPGGSLAPGVADGATVAYLWQYRVAPGDWADLTGGATYTPGASEAGRVLRVKVTVSKSGFQTRSVTSSDTAAVAKGTFSIGAPTVTGTTKVGESLTCAAAGGTPGTLSYAWTRGASSLGSGATYVLTAADRTHEVTCTVTSVRGGYDDATSSTDSATVDYGTFTIAAPSITGAAKVGATLTCAAAGGTPGTLTYAWTRGATPLGSGATYELTADDRTGQVTCTVTSQRAGYTDATNAKDSATVDYGTFTIGAPTITGTAVVGQSLTCAAAAGTPGTVSYAWTRTGSSVGSEATYELTPADRASAVTCTVTSQRTGYTDATRSVTSVIVGKGTFAIGVPSIAGTSAVGETLTCAVAPGTPGTVSYAWTRGVTSLGSDATYELTPADRTHVVTCTVTSVRSGYTDATNSADSATVGYGAFTIGSPSITGAAEVGETLTCAAATGTPGTVSYAWTRGVTALTSGATYELTFSDYGHEVTCTVTSQRAGYVDATNEAETTTVGYGSFTVGTPSITGTAEVGQALTCAAPSGTPGTISYAWTRGVTALASGDTYELVPADRTHEVTCTMTSERTGYTDATSSADSATVGYGAFTIGAPTISGTAEVGRTLTCAPTQGTPGTASYVWTRGGTTLGTAATYELAAGDRTHEVTCTLTAQRDGYRDASATADSATIDFGTFAFGAPTITGTAAVGETLTCAVPAGTPGAASYTWSRGQLPLGAGPAYELTPEDRTHTVTCAATSERDGYHDASNQADSSPVGLGTFTVGPLGVAGAAKVGETLTCAVPAGTPGTVSYAWTRGETHLGVGVSHRLTPADVAGVVTCTVVVQRAGYRDATTSAGSAVVQAGTASTYRVTVTGVEKVGSTLRAQVVDLPAEATVRWQWMRGRDPIAGATSAGFRLPGRVFGERVQAVATVQVPGYEDAIASAESDRVGVQSLTLTLSKSTVRVGGRVRITITQLLPGESWALAFGNGVRVASGRATAAGGRLVRTVRLPAAATFVQRDRHLRITTTNPRRQAGATFTLVR